MRYRTSPLAAIAAAPILTGALILATATGAGAWAGDTTQAKGAVTCNADHVQVAHDTATDSSGVDAVVTASTGPVFLVGDTIPHGSTGKTETFTEPGSFNGTVTVTFSVTYPGGDSNTFAVNSVTFHFSDENCPQPTTTTEAPTTTQAPPPTTEPCSTTTTEQIEVAAVVTTEPCSPPTTEIPRCGVTITCPTLPPAGGCDGPPVACNPQPTTTTVEPTTTVAPAPAPTTTQPPAVLPLDITKPAGPALAFTGVPLALPLGVAAVLLTVGFALIRGFRRRAS